MSVIGDFFRKLYGSSLETKYNAGILTPKTTVVVNSGSYSAAINNYIDDCMSIAVNVFDMDHSELSKLYEWMCSHLMDDIHDSYNLHYHPFQMVAAWKGILLAGDTRYLTYREIMDGMDLKLWYNSYDYFGSQSRLSYALR